MFGVSFIELIVVFLVALVLFGPEQLPVMARQFGKLMGDLKKGSDAVRREFYNSVYTPADEFRRDLEMGGKELRSLKTEVFSLPKVDIPTSTPSVEPTSDSLPEKSPQKDGSSSSEDPATSDEKDPK